MQSSKPYQISLNAATQSRPHFRTNYTYTVAARDAQTAEQAKIEACWRAAQDGLVSPEVYAVVRGFK